jgi:hypothetical protein
MTYEEQITWIFENITAIKDYTCAQMVATIKRYYGFPKGANEQYVSGAISTRLLRMVRAGKLQYHPTKKGPRGGQVYIQTK